MKENIDTYTFHSSQTRMTVKNGKKFITTEGVSIKNGRGMKVIVRSQNGKKTRSKKVLTEHEIQNIMHRKFIPGFFVPCYEDCKKQLESRKTTRKVKKGSK